MKKVLWIVMDSLGIGRANDADRFGDVGSDTLGHIAHACVNGNADNEKRNGLLDIPNLQGLGFVKAYEQHNGTDLPIINNKNSPMHPNVFYGSSQSKSTGKDTPSGHWEMAGVPVTFDWGYFPNEQPCFPAELTDALIKQGGLPGILGDKHSSGTEILDEFGEEHMKTGKPIIYTSADSVYQIAAHEETYGVDKLYELCELAYELVKPYNIGRIIARPFVGEAKGQFKRTSNRRDLSIPPPEKTVLDLAKEAGKEVVSVGKISDIFAGCGITKAVKASTIQGIFDETLKQVSELNKDGIIFANFVDFDMEYGHRRDVAGYAAAIEEFDNLLPELLMKLGEEYLVIFTADHGCDPTWTGSDHTREAVPVFGLNLGQSENNIGERETYADMGASVAEYLGLPKTHDGKSFL